MARTITIKVRTSAEGLELVETLARRGFPAALVSRPIGCHVEIPARRDGLVPLPPESQNVVALTAAATAAPPLRAA